jgi:CubicO group peptidase (beta-lactamase class C family)
MRRGFTRRALVSLAAVVAASAASAVPRAQQHQPSIFTPGSTIPVLESYLESLRQQAGIPGMAAALVRDGEVPWEKGFGYENVATRARVTPDTPFVVGDLTETLSAVLLLQCAEQRRLSLDDPIQKYGLSAPEPTATVRQLLSHTQPAVGFAYSPERYAVLTDVMEWCAPQPFRKSVAHRVLNRLAMIDSVPGTDWKNPALTLPEGLFDQADRDHYRAVLDRLAVPYKVQGRNKVERTELPVSGISATGGLVSTVRDLARFDRGLDGEDGSLLLPETLAAAWSPVFVNGEPSPAGLGWFVQSYKGELVVWHFGYVPNAYSSLIVKLPLRKMTFILLANSDGLSSPFDLAQGDVTKSLFASLFLKLAT